MNAPPAPDQPPAGQITLRFWAAARAATGVAEEQIGVGGPVTLADLIARTTAAHGGPGSRAEAVLRTCSFLLGDRPVGKADPATVLVGPGETVEFLPPFAGG
ncbi:MoaD/ThiS family protein [Nocardioides marmoriginsengisoli]|uniref:MoaD/ThiS family protein n=1 Tax=Nocardioides marmoriginsengisoli TaxID=661483 RepID=A0A3N0CRG3_9ACTN|nr:MoaD/ThiS family protein [Nocardioides marmoriginsengisoli]RNL66072.1 MoaD/ThiS family protein [Nocardioides marmoriginsengisoli]